MHMGSKREAGTTEIHMTQYNRENLPRYHMLMNHALNRLLFQQDGPPEHRDAAGGKAAAGGKNWQNHHPF